MRFHLNLMAALKTSSLTLNCHLWDITRGQRQTTACNIYGFSLAFWSVSNMIQIVVLAGTVKLLCTQIYVICAWVQMRVILCWNPPGGRGDNPHFNVYVLQNVLIWSDLLLHQSQATLLAPLFRWESCGVSLQTIINCLLKPWECNRGKAQKHIHAQSLG